MADQEKNKATAAIADINVTPMVDVMLVMLIIFMVITPMLGTGIRLELAQTRNPIAMQAADQSDAIVCAVTRDGKTFLNTTQLSPEDLPQKVREMLSSRSDKTVFVKVDARAKYDKVVDVVDNLRAAGVDRLGLLTEQMQDKKHTS